MKDKFHTLLLLSIILIIGVYIISLFRYGIGTFDDAQKAYEAIVQWKSGGAWNVLSYPSITEGPFHFYLAWWTPAQWMLPYLINQLNGDNIQMSYGILVILYTIAGLYGYYKVFLRFGFSKLIALSSVAMICANQLFYWHFILFYGGDLFVFGLIPYFVLLFWKASKNITIKLLAVIIIFSFIGIFHKNTFLIFAGIGLFYVLAISYFQHKLTIRNFLSVIISGLIILGTSYYFVLSMGETPGSAIDLGAYRNVKNDLFGDLFYSFGSPVGIFTRFTPAIQKAVLFFQGIGINVNILQFIPFVLTIIFILYAKKNLQKGYINFLIFYIIPLFFIFSLFYIMNRAISYEMRHFAPLAYFFFPGFLAWIFKQRFKKLMIAVLIFINVGDFSLFIFQKHRFDKNHTQIEGHYFYNEEALVLNAVKEIDQKNKNSIFFLQNLWPAVLTIQNNDKIAAKYYDDDWHIFSGMELDFSPKFAIDSINLSNYNKFYIVTNKKEHPTMLDKNQQRKMLFETPNYSIEKIIMD